MQYEEIIDIIQNKRRFGKASGREVTAEMMGRLGHPEQGMQVIHIAGTNGKGSTAAYVSSILQAADFVVGKFTSPHLIRFTERIQVNGVEIPKEDVVRLGQRLLELPMELEYTMFDLSLGIAILYFKEQGCDFVVLETGLGGAKDSTAGLSSIPVVSAFTNIGFDHTQILGDTIEQIAKEKAGILKKGTYAVIGKMEESAKDVIAKEAAALEVPTVNVDNLLTKISTWKSGLNGEFQRDNAALAVGIVETLFNQKSGYLLEHYFNLFRQNQQEECGSGCNGICDACGANPELSSFATWKDYVIKTGLAKAHWPGRMDVICQEPYIMVDGAHNPQGVEALFNSLKAMFPGEKFIFMTAVMADKDYASMMKQMLPIAEEFITLTVDSSRSLQAEDLAKEIQKLGVKAKHCANIEEAFSYGRDLAKHSGCKMIAFGSLYFVGELLRKRENGL